MPATITELLPEWASSRIPDGNYRTFMASLPTRDGRRTGNAVVVWFGQMHYHRGDVTVDVIKVITDAGNVMRLTDSEIKELFWPPEYTLERFLPAHVQAMQDEIGHFPG